MDNSSTAPIVSTRSIVILGMKGAGKTTLWDKLMKKTGGKLDTQVEKINSFNISVNGRTVKIESTKDIGGGDDFIRQGIWDSLIKQNSFVYFLIDLNHIDKDEINIRLKKIKAILENKDVDQKKEFGFKIIGTHYDTYGNGKSKETVKYELIKKLDIKDTNEISERIMIADLFNSNDVTIIENEIVNPQRG